jgi:hypothetical protein
MRESERVLLVLCMLLVTWWDTGEVDMLVRMGEGLGVLTLDQRVLMIKSNMELLRLQIYRSFAVFLC